ncbi:MAG: ammonium transporter [Nitrospinota bacterium]|nr:ammonium transporter [Nitrospinota bacterium]
MLYRIGKSTLSAFIVVLSLSSITNAGEVTVTELKVISDTLWVLIAGVLVFFMNTGFAMIESGLCRAKNTVNILSKNVIVFAVASVVFWAVGFSIMFGDGNVLFGSNGFFLAGADNSPMTGEEYRGVYSSISWAAVPLTAKYFFQMVFAATAATIVSGAVAERIKYLSFFIFSILLVGIIYPITGHWTWGGGFLSELGFVDFAGSTVVHSVGGWAALTGAIILGARKGKFSRDGIPLPLPGHNMGFATVGMFILWLGWFGFNPGSTMAADPEAISLIMINTNLAAGTGVLMASLVSILKIGKPDLSMALNGALAGLVSITAGCDGVSPFAAVLIGSIAGILVVYSILFFDKLKIDDPVGAVSVHLVNGAWGTLAVGLFNVGSGLFYGGGLKQILIQIAGIGIIGLFVVILSSLIWILIKKTIGLRVGDEEESIGLDIGEHGMEAYPDFSRRSVI